MKSEMSLPKINKAADVVIAQDKDDVQVLELDEYRDLINDHNELIQIRKESFEAFQMCVKLIIFIGKSDDQNMRKAGIGMQRVIDMLKRSQVGMQLSLNNQREFTD